MILSDSCWMKDRCVKAQNKNIEAPCLSSDVFCIKLFKLNNLFDLSGLSNKQRKHIGLQLDADMSDSDAFKRLSEIQSYIEKYVEDGNNLFIYSNHTGNGKTSWAIRLIQEYFASIWHKTDLKCRAMFVNVPRLLLSIKDSYGNKNDYFEWFRDNVYDADLVVWDEIGTRELSPHDHEQLLSFINARIDMGKSNIYTSNVIPSVLREVIGERLYSRVINFSECIRLNGADKRGIGQ